MHYSQSQYALNLKDKNAIVYVDAYGKKIRITAEDLGGEEFVKWKAWMDADLHEEAKREHLYKNHNVSIETLPLSRFAVMDRETQMIEEEEREERRKLKEQVAQAFFSSLSDAQQERLWLHAVEGLTTRDIAQMEKATHQSVCESIERAKKNIIKNLQKAPC